MHPIHWLLQHYLGIRYGTRMFHCLRKKSMDNQHALTLWYRAVYYYWIQLTPSEKRSFQQQEDPHILLTYIQ